MGTTGLSQIKVIFVDDQEVFRESFRMLLSNEPTVDLVGTLATGESAVMMVPVLRPDVVIMDVKMTGLDGITAAQRIRDIYPEVGIIMFTAYSDSRHIWEFLRDDPRGKAYLLKSTLGTFDELVRTIHDVDAGRTVFDPTMIGRLGSHRENRGNMLLGSLTKRELEVLSLVATACTNTTIASILFIHPRTVQHHINGIFNKLGLGTGPETGQQPRLQAVLAYLEATGQMRHEMAV